MQKHSTKERPILFQSEMVRAILAGRKTMTRRVVKPQPEKWIDCFRQSMNPQSWLPNSVFMRDPEGFLGKVRQEVRMNGSPIKCPFGAASERLWIRETFIPRAKGAAVIYKADLDPTEAAGIGGMYGGWKPAIFMPRIHSRITLEITGVRVERLRSISEEDAQAEGVRMKPNPDYDEEDPADDEEETYVAGFMRLWEKINGAESWRADPFVWVIAFKRIEPK